MAKKRKKKLNSKFVAFIALGLANGLWLLAVGKRNHDEHYSYVNKWQKRRKSLPKCRKENELLVEEKTKLQDPDYVESYARSNYMFSKRWRTDLLLTR